MGFNWIKDDGLPKIAKELFAERVSKDMTDYKMKIEDFGIFQDIPKKQELKDDIGNRILHEIPEIYSPEEKDPLGLSPHSPGAKLDDGKIDADLVLGAFANALIEVCKIGTFGAKKYTRDGWLSVENGESRYRSAGLRHWLKEATGEEIDPDSQLLHKAHKAWNALAELELYIRNNKGE